MKNLFYPLLIATAFVATACTNNQEDDVTPVDPNGKTPISFVGETSNTPVTRAGFADATQIVMHIRSTKAKDDSKIRETRTLATAAIDKTRDDFSTSAVGQTGAYTRYWDDAYGRDAQLSVFAIAVPEKTYEDATLENKLTGVSGGNVWEDAALSELVTWTVSTDQSESGKLAAEDLVYSNNIQGADNDETNDKRLKFKLNSGSPTNGPGTFAQGKLEFKHALSRITVTLVKGDGYGDGSFKFPVDDKGKVTSNVKVLSVPTSGDLNIENGSWKSVTTADITKMYTTEMTSNAACTLMAQMIPGYVITDGNVQDNVLEFIIDDNKYFITQDMMFDALKGKDGITESTTSTITMEKGRNYVFNIKVGKSKIINVTATLEPWTDVNAEKQTMDNSHITLNLFTNANGTASKDFDLYRLNDPSGAISIEASEAKNWWGNYTTDNKATLTPNGSKWETNWYFENNMAFYHFRTVNKGTKIMANETSAPDYFEISSGDQDSHDFHWGAPFISSTTSPIKYSTTDGYAASLSPAIGATNSTINLTELHMMSNINVVIRTTKNTSSDHVVLETTETNGSTTTTKQCEVSLTYFYADGQVKMGNGLVSTTGDLSTKATFIAPAPGIYDNTTYDATGAFTFAVVPQALVRSTGTHLYVGITIKTPDNNQYYVVEKLSDILATSTGGSQNYTDSNKKINFWYPNHSYTYTFTLTKTGIKNVTCTVEKWTEVTAKDQTITLED